MGQSLTVDGAVSLAALLQKLERAGTPAQIVMVDGALVMPTAAPPAQWRDVRLRAQAGTLALKREGTRVDVIVFGNADAAMLTLQHQVAKLLEP